MNQKPCAAGFCLLLFALLNTAPRAAQGGQRYRKEIEPYVAFLRQQQQSPVDYVMGLFAEHDLVILCERDHRETTQYDFIFDLVSDPRFVAQVGNVFTEVGTSSLRKEVREFLFSENLTQREVEDKALKIYRNIEFYPIWAKHNFFGFLKRLYAFNNSLQERNKINLYFSDVPFSWESMTAEKYRTFLATINNGGQRDKIMAKQVIDSFQEIVSAGERRQKALVIMNGPHAFNDRFSLARKSTPLKAETVGRYLFEAFPGRVANVMLNALAHVWDAEGKFTMKMIQNGKWDAAFEIIGSRSVGFDLAASPFGEDPFDYFSISAKKLTYQDIFTGFVFYRPIEQLRLAIGIPGLTDAGFGKVILERFAIAGNPVQGEAAADLVANFSRASGRVEVFTYMKSGVFGDPKKAVDLSEKDHWLKAKAGR